MRAIYSVLAQTHADFELIVIDDGSTDDGPRLVRQVQDPRLVLVRQPNGGESAARNTGIERATTRYVAFLDADDEWDAEHLETLVRLIDDYPDAGIYCTGYRFVEPSGKVVRPRWSGHPERGYVPRYFLSVAQGDLIATASSVCIPIVVLQEVGLFPIGDRLGADQDMWARVALRYPVAVDSRTTTTYFRNADNRCCITCEYDGELPYLARLQSFLDEKRPIAAEVRKDIEAYIRQGLFSLVSLNVRNGRADAARRLLRDSRLRKTGRRLIAWTILARFPSSLAIAALKTADVCRMKYRSFGRRDATLRQMPPPADAAETTLPIASQR